MTIRDVLNGLSAADAPTVTGPHKIASVGEVYVKPMNGHARAAMESMCCDENGYARNVATIKALVIAETLCDAKGKRVYSATEHKAILDLPSKIVEDLFDLGKRVSRIGDDAIEDAEKNSEEVQPPGSEKS